MLVYVAGPYRGDIERNISQARRIGIALWEMGHVAIVPHLNTSNFEVDCSVPDDCYLQGDLNILCRCDAIVMTPDWETSVGARGEYDYADKNGIPIYVYPDLPPINLTEIRNPVQAEAFRNVIMQMYRLHLKKNADYSPANILGTGWIGLVTRLWDKMARLMNLAGFRIDIASSRFEAPQEPKNESIDDTLIDAAVYAVIGLLLRRGAWGR